MIMLIGFYCLILQLRMQTCNMNDKAFLELRKGYMLPSLVMCICLESQDISVIPDR